MITRRCTQRQFLLRPDEVTNRAFAYCLAEAAARCAIDILMTTAMSNHHHTVIYDREGRYPEFLERFHKLLARCMNAYRGRWENFWSSEQVCVVHLKDVADVIAKIVYVATNPLTANLVERVHQWPGVNGYRLLREGRECVIDRPDMFFRKNGKMPARVTLHLVVPKELGMTAEELLEILERRIAEVEAELRARRKRANTRVLGPAGVLAQSWKTRPKSVEPRRGLRPRVAAKNFWSRMEALQRNADFLDSYRVARTALAAKTQIAFPPGTYYLRRFNGVEVATPA